MEGYQAQARERSHPPYQRPASRSSTSTRMTSQSANSSASHISSSPQLQSAYAAHRHHYASAKLSSSPRPSSRAMPTPQLSREGSTESARQTPVSSFLQERLQKERQAESQKYTASTPRSNSDMSTSCELGSSQKSPVKQCGDGNRPQSSCGDPTQKKGGLALKEMEQVGSPPPLTVVYNLLTFFRSFPVFTSKTLTLNWNYITVESGRR